LIIASLIPYYDYETFINFPASIDLSNYSRVLNHPSFVSGLYNSLILSVMIAAITVLAGIIMAFTIYRTKVYGSKVFEFIGTMPLAFPPLVLSESLPLKLSSACEPSLLLYVSSGPGGTRSRRASTRRVDSRRTARDFR